MAAKTKRKKPKYGVIVHEDEQAEPEMVVTAPSPAPKAVKHHMTAAETRDWLRKQAGWPAIREKQAS